MSSRWMMRLLLVAALALAPGATGCSRKVSVQTGTQVVCTYGHSISRSVRTVEVAADKAASYHVQTITRTCAKHQQLEKLYAEAQRALSKDDTATASKRLAQVVAGDAAFGNASSQLEAIRSGKVPDPDTSRAGGSAEPTRSSNPGGSDTSGPVASLRKYAPDALDGYTSRAPLPDPNGITREYLPKGSAKALLLTIVVEQERSSDVARLVLKEEVKLAYPKAAATVRAGSHSAYFGTDGSAYAVMAFTKGSVFVVLEMAAKSGVQPDALKSALSQVAAQLP